MLAALLELIEDGEEVPDEVLEIVTSILMSKIQSFSEERPIEPNKPGKSEIPGAPHESSNVNGFKYSPKTGELLVQFHGPYPQAEGSIYKYENVPPFIYDVISRGAIGPKTSGANKFHRWQKNITPSLGGSVNALLKAGKFSFSRIS